MMMKNEVQKPQPGGVATGGGRADQSQDSARSSERYLGISREFSSRIGRDLAGAATSNVGRIPIQIGLRYSLLSLFALDC